jgi:phage-related protein
MFKKILKWLVVFLPTAIGIVEAVLKLIKELLTLVADILYPIIPSAKFKTIVTWLRAKVDIVYDGFSKVKEQILKAMGLI